MELVDMQGLKPCPLRVLVQVQVQVILLGWVFYFFYALLTVPPVTGGCTPVHFLLISITDPLTVWGAASSAWLLHTVFIYCALLGLVNWFVFYISSRTKNYFMLFITFSNLWSFSFFFLFTYITFIVSSLIYVLPILANPIKNTATKIRSEFSFINSSDFLYVLLTPLFCLVMSMLIWVAPTTSAWFGHLVVSSFQLKMALLILFNFATVSAVLVYSSYFSSREIYDYIITLINFLYWTTLLFFSSSIFTTIFIIEVISALIFLLLITSTFSTTFFYRNADLSFGHLFQQSTPFSYLQSILYFFWISLISSLNLFLFCLMFYIKIFTFDWYLMEHIFLYLTSTVSVKDLVSLGFTWFILVFCLFLKCGVAPLYIWKPTFFKGIPFYTIFFYITFFYFVLFLFVIHLLTSYFSEIFYFYTYVTVLFLLLGLVMLLFILCESYYLKAFLAMSSILNSLFVILALSSAHTTDLVMWL